MCDENTGVVVSLMVATFPSEDEASHLRGNRETSATSRVRELGAVRNVRSDRCAPTEPSVTAATPRPPRGGPAQRLGAIPEGHQAGASNAEAAVTSLRRRRRRGGGRRRGGEGNGWGRRWGRQHGQRLGGDVGGQVVVVMVVETL